MATTAHVRPIHDITDWSQALLITADDDIIIFFDLHGDVETCDFCDNGTDEWAMIDQATSIPVGYAHTKCLQVAVGTDDCPDDLYVRKN